MINFKKILTKHPEKLKYIKQLGCATPNENCCEGADPAHFRRGLFLGANIKDDRYALPLCRVCHSAQHHHGEKAFWGDRILEAKVLCLQLHVYWLEEDLDGMRDLVERFRA